MGRGHVADAEFGLCPLPNPLPQAREGARIRISRAVGASLRHAHAADRLRRRAGHADRRGRHRGRRADALARQHGDHRAQRDYRHGVRRGGRGLHAGRARGRRQPPDRSPVALDHRPRRRLARRARRAAAPALLSDPRLADRRVRWQPDEPGAHHRDPAAAAGAVHVRGVVPARHRHGGAGRRDRERDPAGAGPARGGRRRIPDRHRNRARGRRRHAGARHRDASRLRGRGALDRQQRRPRRHHRLRPHVDADARPGSACRRDGTDRCRLLGAVHRVRAGDQRVRHRGDDVPHQRAGRDAAAVPDDGKLRGGLRHVGRHVPARPRAAQPPAWRARARHHRRLRRLRRADRLVARHRGDDRAGRNSRNAGARLLAGARHRLLRGRRHARPDRTAGLRPDHRVRAA